MSLLFSIFSARVRDYLFCNIYNILKLNNSFKIFILPLFFFVCFTYLVALIQMFHGLSILVYNLIFRLKSVCVSV